MTPLRRKRLLLLATKPDAWHKRWYHEYYSLIGEGLVGWVIGQAYLTNEGQAELEKFDEIL